MAATSAIVLYGMNIADRKSDSLLGFVQQTVQSLPEITQSLPPILADVLNDTRSPDYIAQLDFSVEMISPAESGGRVRPVIEIHNRGSEVVSLLSLRVVVLDGKGRPLAERNEWGATPIAADGNWRGPLLPGATRYITVGTMGLPSQAWADDDLRVDLEVTDVRVWKERVAGRAGQ